ncbi:MAG: alanine racemase [Elusimicrobia bacterium]|nr:alanine racemase [Elusimicrobiota bacterium]
MMRHLECAKWIEIDLKAIHHNIRWLRRRLAGATRWLAVVKANAYGHGAVAISRLAMKEGACGLGVLTVEEALELRSSGIRAPIILLAPPLPAQAPLVAREHLEATVDSPWLLAALNRAARTPIRVHLDIDFGLRRWGLAPKRLPDFLRIIKKTKGLRLAGLSTHIDYVPGRNAVEAETKLRSFQRLAVSARRDNPNLICHAANSSILLDFPRRQMDMARIGNILYGINPTDAEVPLRNAWRFYARIISLTRIGKGRAIGYASEFIAPKHMAIAALPAGYADGLTMEPAQRLIGFGGNFQYWGILRGRKTPFVGRCSISHVLLDVGRVPDARVGDAVLLPVRRTAATARLPRVYING